ncbi:MMPL family transporter [Dactylosporangium vinaceum]|uniref:MMPL family transporter n=1 Tax=Dactylosporangium vinaceum TaxID=53362 RepID=A0ABV5MC00_9ACTN|nr:MMPL family transporter [Dactylosporangium vinaceum]UAC01343.1 MMPL family transporter [Dactylosporangium vinaceum]
MSAMTVRAARWSAGHPWRAVGLWLAFVAASLGAGLAIGPRDADGADYRVGEAGRAEAMAAEGGLQRAPEELVLITGAAAGQDAAAGDVAARMAALPEVAGVAPAVRSADGRALLVRVTMRGPELEGRRHVGPLLAQTAAVQAAYPQLRIEETGAPSIGLGVNAQRGADLARSERIALPVTFVVLWLVFGSALLAAVPLVLALSAIAASTGLAMMASHVFPDAGVGTNVIILMGLAVGVDYSLFYVKREREERARAGGPLDARALVELAAATSGRAVAGSGLAVAVCGATLYLASDVIFASLATATILVTLVAVAGSLSVLPALLVLLGRRRVRPARQRRSPGRVPIGLRRPVVTLVAAAVALLALAAPIAGLRLTEISLETYSRSVPAMQVRDRLLADFPEFRVAHQVVVRAEPAQAGRVRAGLDEVARRAQADPLFAGAPRISTSADGRVSVLTLSVPYRNDSPQGLASLEHLRAGYLPAALGGVPGAEWAVSGDVARYTDYPAHQRDRIPVVLGALLLATFFMTVLVFRSVVLGLLGAVLSVVSTAAAIGVLVLAFQGAGIGSRVPLFLAVILVGLSMDYQFFVVSRVREAAGRGLPAAAAVAEGAAASASVVTSAAVVMVTVFVSFVFVDLLELQQMGVVLAAGVLIDAFVVRTLVLPAALRLLGDRVWWPARPGRVG